MSTPDFILELRKKVGHELLWLNGITAYVQRDDGRILLGRRTDTQEWALVYGINEPGEDPADTTVREVKEETGVDITVTDLACIKAAQNPTVYSNGDQTQYLDMLFLCQPARTGNIEPYIGDDESIDVGWFQPDQLPQPIAQSTLERLQLIEKYLENAARGDRRALFFTSYNRQ